MILALLTTMNSKVKVHVVDGSGCVLDCSHDKKKGAGPRPPTIPECFRVLSGLLRKTNQGWGWGWSTGSRQRCQGMEKTGCRAAWWREKV